MSSGILRLIIIAIIVGLAGAFLFRWYMREEPKAEAAPRVEELITVPLAGADLPKGRKIQMGDIVITRITPREFNDKYRGVMMMNNAQQIMRFIVKKPIRQGQPFLVSDMYPEGTGPSVTEDLRPGFVAAVVPIATSSGGVVQKGQFVDVVFRTSEDTPEAFNQPVPEITKVAMQRVRVLEVREGEQNTTNVWLEMLPVESTLLETLKNRGEISLVLRPDEGQIEEFEQDPQSLANWLGLKPPPEEPPPPPPFITAIYRRGRASLNSFMPAAAVPETTEEEENGFPTPVDEPSNEPSVQPADEPGKQPADQDQIQERSILP